MFLHIGAVGQGHRVRIVDRAMAFVFADDPAAEALIAQQGRQAAGTIFEGAGGQLRRMMRGFAAAAKVVVGDGKVRPLPDMLQQIKMNFAKAEKELEDAQVDLANAVANGAAPAELRMKFAIMLQKAAAYGVSMEELEEEAVASGVVKDADRWLPPGGTAPWRDRVSSILHNEDDEVFTVVDDAVTGEKELIVGNVITPTVNVTSGTAVVSTEGKSFLEVLREMARVEAARVAKAAEVAVVFERNKAAAEALQKSNTNLLNFIGGINSKIGGISAKIGENNSTL